MLSEQNKTVQHQSPIWMFFCNEHKHGIITACEWKAFFKPAKLENINSTWLQMIFQNCIWAKMRHQGQNITALVHLITQIEKSKLITFFCGECKLERIDRSQMPNK